MKDNLPFKNLAATTGHVRKVSPIFFAFAFVAWSSLLLSRVLLAINSLICLQPSVHLSPNWCLVLPLFFVKAIISVKGKRKGQHQNNRKVLLVCLIYA